MTTVEGRRQGQTARIDLPQTPSVIPTDPSRCHFPQIPPLSFPPIPPLSFPPTPPLSFPQVFSGNPWSFSFVPFFMSSLPEENAGFPIKNVGNDRKEVSGMTDRTAGHDGTVWRA